MRIFTQLFFPWTTIKKKYISKISTTLDIKNAYDKLYKMGHFMYYEYKNKNCKLNPDKFLYLEKKKIVLWDVMDLFSLWFKFYFF